MFSVYLNKNISSMKTAFYISICISLTLIMSSCGKKDKDNTTNTNTAPVFCSLQTSTLVINDTVNQLTTDTSYQTANNTFYLQYQDAAGKGCSFDFEGNQIPAEGNFTITPNFTEISPGSKKVYVQFFYNGNSFQGQSGAVKISGSGSSAIIEFCKVNFKNSFGENHTCSFKSNLP